jgi:hypothetical protein
MLQRRSVPLVSILAAVLALALAAPAHATLLGADASGELVGSRDVTGGGGLKGYNEWENGLFTVSWVITINGPASAHYEYTFTGLGGKDISNTVFDLTDNCGVDPFCYTNVTINGSTVGVVTEFGNHSGIIGGLKIEGVDGMEGAVYAFDSNRLPVYGHLAVKDGGGNETCSAPGASNIVCSNQLVGIGDPDAAINFIAVPDGIIVPEPGALALWAGSLVALALRRRA